MSYRSIEIDLEKLAHAFYDLMEGKREPAECTEEAYRIIRKNGFIDSTTGEFIALEDK
jgi:hypothetical protein